MFAPAFSSFLCFLQKPKSGEVETEKVYAASESEAKDAVNVNYDAIKPIKLSYSW